MAAIALSPDVLASLKPSKIFKDRITGGQYHTSLSFDDKGDQAVVAGEDHSIQLFDCKTGKHKSEVHSKKYGVHLARFTHASSSVIYASTKEDDTIRYLSLHDNTFIRYYKGHTQKVTSIEMSPTEDVFISSAEDSSVKVWDVRVKDVQGSLRTAGPSAVAFDPSGAVVAATINITTSQSLSSVLLYDRRKLDADPFLTIQIPDPIIERASFPPRIPITTSVKFSNDGEHLLVGTSSGVHYVINSFTGSIVYRLEGHAGLERVGMQDDRPMMPTVGASGEETSWTPDGRYVISGSADGRICIWDIHQSGQHPGTESTLLPMKVIEGNLGSPSRIVGWNPTKALLVSGGKELIFWLPDLKSLNT